MSMIEYENKMIMVCDKCNQIIGVEVETNGRNLLNVGASTVYSLHGYCVCGDQVHWDARDAIFRKMMKDLKRTI